MITDWEIEKIEKRALEIWRERELSFPDRVRRMTPDVLDRASGAWWACRMKAALELEIPKRSSS
jgi:hypothetical protein